MTDLENYKKTDFCTYQRFVKKLIYFSYDIRPDIAFVVEQLSRHNANPRKGYFQAVKKIVRYFKGIIKIKLIFGQKSVK